MYVFLVFPESGVAGKSVAADFTDVELSVYVFVFVAEQLNLGRRGEGTLVAVEWEVLLVSVADFVRLCRGG